MAGRLDGFPSGLPPEGEGYIRDAPPVSDDGDVLQDQLDGVGLAGNVELLDEHSLPGLVQGQQTGKDDGGALRESALNLVEQLSDILAVAGDKDQPIAVEISLAKALDCRLWRIAGRSRTGPEGLSAPRTVCYASCLLLLASLFHWVTAGPYDGDS